MEKKKTIKAWGIWDIQNECFTFVTLQKGNWYIAPSVKRRFKAKSIIITYSLPSKTPKKKV